MDGYMDNTKQEQTEKAKKDYGTRVFLFGLEVIFYFGAPAVLGTILGKWIERMHPEKGNGPTIAILFATYILSWTIVFFRFRAIRKKYNK